MTHMKNLQLNLEVGQQILVGPHNDKATITKIEFHEKSGEVETQTIYILNNTELEYNIYNKCNIL